MIPCQSRAQRTRTQRTQAHDDVGQTRTSTSCSARSRFDERGDRARAAETTYRSGSGVDHEDGLNIFNVAIFIGELATLTNGNNRAHRVEEVTHKQREHEEQQGRLQEHLNDCHGVGARNGLERGRKGREVQTEVPRRRQRRYAQRNADDRRRNDGDEQAALHVEHLQKNRDRNSDKGNDSNRRRQITKRKKGRFARDDNAATLQTDKCDKDQCRCQ